MKAMQLVLGLTLAAALAACSSTGGSAGAGANSGANGANGMNGANGANGQFDPSVSGYKGPRAGRVKHPPRPAGAATEDGIGCGCARISCVSRLWRSAPSLPGDRVLFLAAKEACTQSQMRPIWDLLPFGCCGL